MVGILNEYDKGLYFGNSRWHGELSKLTASNAPERLFISRPASTIFRELTRAAGIPAATADSSALPYTRLLGGGADGIRDLEDACDGFAHDRPAGPHLEYNATRAARAVTESLTDLVPNKDAMGNETETRIGTPHDLSQLFGIVTHADAELHIVAPVEDSASEAELEIPFTEITATSGLQTLELPVETGFLLSTGPTDPIGTVWSIGISFEQTLLMTIVNPAVAMSKTMVIGAATVAVTVNNVSWTSNGSTLKLSLQISGTVTEEGDTGPAPLGIQARVGVSHARRTLEYDTRVFRYGYEDADRARKYGGRRRRGRPIIVGGFERTALEEFYTPSAATISSMQLLARREVYAYREPIAVYRVRLDDRVALRRVSDKVHLRLGDGTDADFYIEHLETHLAQPVHQIAYLAPVARAVAPALPTAPSPPVLPPLDPIRRIEAVTIGLSTATVQVTPRVGYNVRISAEYQLEGAATWTALDSQAATSTNPARFELSGLTSGSTYNFRADTNITFRTPTLYSFETDTAAYSASDWSDIGSEIGYAAMDDLTYAGNALWGIDGNINRFTFTGSPVVVNGVTQRTDRLANRSGETFASSFSGGFGSASRSDYRFEGFDGIVWIGGATERFWIAYTVNNNGYNQPRFGRLTTFSRDGYYLKQIDGRTGAQIVLDRGNRTLSRRVQAMCLVGDLVAIVSRNPGDARTHLFTLPADDIGSGALTTRGDFPAGVHPTGIAYDGSLILLVGPSYFGTMSDIANPGGAISHGAPSKGLQAIAWTGSELIASGSPRASRLFFQHITPTP